jgi:hypothetical protein
LCGGLVQPALPPSQWWLLVCGGSLLSGGFASFLFVSGVESLRTGSSPFRCLGGVVDGSAVVKGLVICFRRLFS